MWVDERGSYRELREFVFGAFDGCTQIQVTPAEPQLAPK